MATGLATLTVWLTADTKKFSSGLDRAKKTLLNWKMAATAGAAAAGAAAVAFGIKSVKAYMAQEEAVNNLAAALQNAGNTEAAMLPMLEQHAAKLQRMTIYGDEAVLSVMAYGKNLGIQTDQLDEAATAAAGLAAKYRIDLNTAMMLVGRASQGQTTTLKRYGIVLDENLDSQGKFNQLLKIGADNFGLAQAQTDTLAGKMQQLGNVWGDIKELFGELIVDVFDLTKNLGDATSALRDFAQTFKRNIHGVKFIVKSLIIEITSALDTTWAVVKTLFNNVDVVLRNAMDNIINMLMWGYGNLDQTFMDSFELVKAFVKDVINVFANLGEALFDLITNPMEGFDPTKILAEMGKNIERTISELKIKPLEIVDYHDELKDFGDEIEKVMLEKEAKLSDLFKDSLEKAGAADMRGVAKQASEAKKSGVKIESSIIGAVQKGSAEALKLESQKTTKEDKIANNTKATADGVGKIAKSIEKFIGLAAPASGATLEEVF